MTVNLLKDKEFVEELKKKNNYEIFLYFIRISNKKNQTIIKLSFDEDLEEEFLKIFLNLDDSIPQDVFSPSKDGSKHYIFNHNEKIKKELSDDLEEKAVHEYKYSSIQSVISSIDTDSSSILDELKKIKLHNLSGYAVKIKQKQSDKRVLYFSQFEKFTTLKKGIGVMANVNNDTVKKLHKENTVGLKPYINSYIGIENKLLIISKNYFESMFKMGEIYVEEAERVMRSIPNLSSTFSNFSEFHNHVKNDSRLSKRVASLEAKRERVELVCSNIDTVKNAIKEPEYKDKIGNVVIKDNKIVYDKKSIDQIITLLSDLAAESYITKKKFVAESD